MIRKDYQLNMKNYVALRKDDLGSIIIFLFVTAYLIDHLNIGYAIIQSTIGLFGYLFLIEPYKLPTKIFDRNMLKILSYVFVMLVLAFASSLFRNAFALKELMASVSYMGISIILLKTKLNDKIIDLLYFGIVLFFMVHIVIGTDPNDVFRTSRNTISMFIIFCTVLVILVKLKNNKKVSSIYVILNLVICVWAVGRNGIISSVMLLLGYYISYFLRHKVKLIHTVIILLGITIIVLSSLIFADYFHNISEQILLSLDHLMNSRLHDSARESMISTYIDTMFNDFYSFIFGVKLIDIPLFVKFKGNPHNSYLRLHSKYGILGFTLVIIFMVKAAIKALQRKKYLVLTCMVVVAMRIFTDVYAFTGIFDVVVYYFIFNYAFNYHDQSVSFFDECKNNRTLMA